MNELQIRISADIKELQTALTRAKKTIQELDKETATGSNVGFKRKIGLIEQLENKAKKLRVALRHATNEDQVERYNKELTTTISEMSRLNALGRQVGGSINQTGAAFKKTGSAIGGTNSVAIEFNRIVQDAPFGLIGIGNNLQQLAGNFANVRAQAGSTGKAVKSSLSALISPVNLGVLAVSALTAGFTAYQMGAFDGLFATKDFRKELDDFAESLNAVDSARHEALSSADEEIIKLNALKDTIEDETLSRDVRNKTVDKALDKYPQIFSDLEREKILAGEVGDAYERLTKQLIAKAEVSSSVKRIVDLNEDERLLLEKNKDKLDEINEARQRIARFQGKADKAKLEMLNAETALEKDLALRRKLGAENSIRFLRGENAVVDKLIQIDEDRARLKDTINNSLKESLKLTKDISEAELLEMSGSDIKNLAKPKLESLASALEKEIQDSARKAANSTDEIVKSMASERINEFRAKLKLVNEQLAFYKDETDKAKKSTKDFTEGWDDLIESIKLGNKTAEEAAEKVPSLAEALLQEMRDADQVIDFKPIHFDIDFDPSQFDKLTEAQQKVIDDAIRARQLAEEFQKDMEKIGGQLSNVFAEAFEKGIFEGENFFDSIAQGFKRLLAQLASQLAAAAFLNILAAITTGGTSAAFGAAASANPFGSLFGGARANGGPVSSNKAYLVGERGPEIFQPSTSGRIIPNIPSSPMVSASGASAGVMQKIDVNVYGEIMNDRIVLSEARGNRANGRFYGING